MRLLPNFAHKMLRWVNTTSVRMQMGGKLLSPVCFIVLLALAGCNDDDGYQKFIPYKGPLEEAEKIEVLYSEQAKLKVRVRTAKQIKLPNEDKFFPKKIFVDFFDAAGQQVITTLDADSAHFYTRTGLYVVKGNVRVNTQKQELLLTDELTWSPNTRKVYTDKKVIIENKMSGERINGYGLDANQDFSQTNIRHPTAILNAPAGLNSY